MGSLSASHTGSPLKEVTDKDRPLSILLPASGAFGNLFQLTAVAGDEHGAQAKRWQTALGSAPQAKLARWGHMNSQPDEACPAPVLLLFGARLEKAIPAVKIHTDTSPPPPPKKKSQVKPACSQRGRQPEDRLSDESPAL